jgi:ABC-type multidrug transport system ATPase subunit
MSIAVSVTTQSPAPSRPAIRPIPGPAALLVDHATKRFRVDRRKPPVVAVDDVSARIGRGDIYGLLGANGSGKSTFIRLVSGLLTLDEGRVEVFGHDLVREEMAVKRLINRVSVDAAFFKKLSPAENLSFAARLYGLTAARHVARRPGSWPGSASARSGWPGRWSR